MHAPSMSETNSLPAPSRGGPTVRRIILGNNLRRLREQRGITFQAAARTIGASQPKLSRLELGRGGCKEHDIAALLTLYGVEDEAEREHYLALARGANTTGWWHLYSDVTPAWMETFLGLEEAASLIRSYQAQRIPGLLQTADYARAFAQVAYPNADEAAIERHVDLRLRRQQILGHADQPARYWVVLDEAALRRPLGGRTVMRAQIKHLLGILELSNITVQVARLATGRFAAVVSPLTILRFAEPDLPDVAYIEQLTSALYLDKRNDVERYLLTMDGLCAAAEKQEASQEMLEQLLAEY